MGAGFYYEVSSLPLLRLGEAPPLTVEEYVAFCRRQLPPAAAAAVADADLEPGGAPASAVEQAWDAWETCMRNALVRLRAGRAELPAAASLRPESDVFPGDRQRVAAIMAEADPLKQALELDRLRWRRLEDLAVGHDFDAAALILYKLKLLLVSRWARIAVEAGLERHDAAVRGGTAEAARQRVATGFVATDANGVRKA